jgi:hypothetical protein
MEASGALPAPETISFRPSAVSRPDSFFTLFFPRRQHSPRCPGVRSAKIRCRLHPWTTACGYFHPVQYFVYKMNKRVMTFAEIIIQEEKT